MKIVACWICYNNIVTLPYSIDAVYDLIDELVIVDGSFKGKRSTDGTWEYLQKLKASSKKPLHIVASQMGSLFNKHNEHVDVTGNHDSNLWTWQIDSDEIYSEANAKAVSEAIRSDKYNGIIVKLMNIERFIDGKFFIANNLDRIDTNQMRVYRMHKGLNFKTKDSIFEWIVYEDGSEVQRGNNKIHANSKTLRVDHYHCLATVEQAIARYNHYGSNDPVGTEARIRSPGNSTEEIKMHALATKWLPDTMTNKEYYKALKPFKG